MNVSFHVVDTNVPLTAKESSQNKLEIYCFRISYGRTHRFAPTTRYVVGANLRVRPLSTNQANSERCTLVEITPKPDDELDFVEFPEHPGLHDFDRSDRKFVSVSAVHPVHPPILQAADSKWWGTNKQIF